MLYGLDENQVKRIKKLLTAFEAGSLYSSNRQPAKTKNSPIETYLVKTDETIPALTPEGAGSGSGSGDLPGSGLATIQKIAGTIQSQGIQVTVYNLTSDDILSGTLVTVTREPVSGSYLIGSLSGSETAQIYEGFLDTNMAASTGGGANEALATLSVYEGSGILWADSGDNITIANRNDSLTGKVGDYVIVGLVDGEFRPIAVEKRTAAFPSGSTDCDCGDCLDLSETITTDCTDCETGPTGYKVLMGDGVEYTLNGPDSCVWATDSEVTICNAEDYLSLTVGGLGAGEVSLTHGDLVYTNVYPWQCTCTNEMRLAVVADCPDVTCKVCIKPFYTPSTFDIYFIDPATGSYRFGKRYSISGISGYATCLAAEETGSFLVSGFGYGSGGYVKRYNAAGQFVRGWAGSSDASYSAITRDGYSYLRHNSSYLLKADYFGNTIFDISGLGLIRAGVNSVGNSFIRTSAGPNQYISEVNATGTFTGNSVLGNWAAVDSEDNVIVILTNQIKKYNSDLSTAIWTTTFTGNDNNAISITADDEIVVTTRISGTYYLKKFSSAGVLLWTVTFSSSALINSVSPTGDIFVSDGTTIYSYDTDGNFNWSKTSSSVNDLTVIDGGSTLIVLRSSFGVKVWS